MRLCHPPDGSTSPKYKLLCFITTKKFCKEKNALAFNQDRCCHLALCLRLIPFHWLYQKLVYYWWCSSHDTKFYFGIDKMIPTVLGQTLNHPNTSVNFFVGFVGEIRGSPSWITNWRMKLITPTKRVRRAVGFWSNLKLIDYQFDFGEDRLRSIELRSGLLR